MKNRFILNAIVILLGFILTIALSEALLRAFGYHNWHYKSKDVNEPTMHEPHSVLGWRNKKGNYLVPAYDPSGDDIYINFLDRGQRRTGGSANYHTDGKLLLVGGSYTQGWAISDNETFSWKLQEEIPSLKVLNYGTAGYGSYQSLLVLEQELPLLKSVNFVLYGFFQDHENRNVAPSEWLRGLSSYSRRGHINVPYATLDENQKLVRHPPERYLSLPFRESLALVAFIEKIYMDFRTRKRTSQKMLITKKIMLQMNRVADKYNATFIVVLLSATDSTKKIYMEFLDENNIQFIDCTFDMTKEMTVPGEGHPNGRMNTLWAQCILDALDKKIKRVKTHLLPNDLNSTEWPPYKKRFSN